MQKEFIFFRDDEFDLQDILTDMTIFIIEQERNPEVIYMNEKNLVWYCSLLSSDYYKGDPIPTFNGIPVRLINTK